MDSDHYRHDTASMSTTPLLAAYDAQPYDHHEQDETDGTVRYYDILLIPYMLSYSASVPCLVRPLTRLFEKALVPTWLSHYTLNIGDYHFHLHREGKLPFASVAYFSVVQGNDPMQMRNAFREERRWTGSGLKLGSTTLDPREIVNIVIDQDTVYQKNNTRASNCLIDIPREYSLLQANCQHFILELVRRISPQIDFTGDTWIKIQKESTRPRFYCHLLMSCTGMAVNLLVVLLPLHISILVVAISYHYIFTMVMLQDYIIRNHRTELFYNEQRYLNITGSDADRKPAQYSTQESERRYWMKVVLTTISMAWPLAILAYHWFLQLGLWVIGFITLAFIAYCAFVCVPAYWILALLKSKNRITLLRKKESQKRVKAAYKSLTQRWIQVDGDSICSVCSPDIYEENRTSFLNVIIDNVDTTQQPFGRKDVDRAIPFWVSKHQSRNEIIFSFKWRATLCIYGVSGITGLLLWLLYEHWSVEH